MKLLILLAFCSLVLTCHATPKDRVKDTLSDEDHFAKDGDHAHNPEFDHEAFLGKDEAKTFDELTPDQSKDKLGKLFHKVDADADNFVTEDELKKWIQHTQNRYIREDSDKQMKQNDMDKDGHVTWEEYKKATYGFLDENGDKADYEGMLQRDEKRFKLADKEGDMKLKLAEFSAFLHPENHEHMKGIVVNETLEDIDKDKDGSISLEEYLGDLWPEEDRAKGEEPEWVKTERDQFNQFRDKNKDGKMDADEVKDWILPADYDHVSSEAQHLVSESDTDKDGKISKEEMVEKYDLFVGSQATDFGEIFKSDHIEL